MTRINKHSGAFLYSFSFFIEGDMENGEKMKFKTRLCANLTSSILQCTPIVNNIVYTVLLIKRTELPRSEREKANLAICIIAAMGLGILLLLPQLIGTGGRIIYNLTHENKINKSIKS